MPGTPELKARWLLRREVELSKELRAVTDEFHALCADQHWGVLEARLNLGPTYPTSVSGEAVSDAG